MATLSVEDAKKNGVDKLQSLKIEMQKFVDLSRDIEFKVNALSGSFFPIKELSGIYKQIMRDNQHDGDLIHSDDAIAFLWQLYSIQNAFRHVLDAANFFDQNFAMEVKEVEMSRKLHKTPKTENPIDVGSPPF